MPRGARVETLLNRGTGAKSFGYLIGRGGGEGKVSERQKGRGEEGLNLLRGVRRSISP